MRAHAQRRRDLNLLFVGAIASALSLLSFQYYFQHNQVLLYGDAVAHINIARRLFDSQTPGLLQLGTVWLPLPHLLMAPFLVSDWLWQSGVGGSIPSMIAFVFGVTGIFRLTRGVLGADERTQPWAGAGAWVAAAIFAANPNLLYLQATAMTEPLYLALFIWAVVYFWEWTRLVAAEKAGRNGNPLWKCAVCLAGTELTRYDGWFLAAAAGGLAVVVVKRHWSDRPLRAAVAKFLVAIAIAPLFWLTYNWAAYGDPLEFARGPYSARAIEQKTAQPGYPAHPGAGNLAMAGSFFLKSAELNMAPGNWGRLWVAVLLAAAFVFLGRLRVAGNVLLLLWTPLLFYALSIARGGVPLFVPTWWPHTWYNIRYGLQFLPLFALSGVSLAATGPSLVRTTAARFGRVPAWLEDVSSPRLRGMSAGAILLLCASSYLSVWRSAPLCFTEAWVNSRTKLSLEASVARIVSAFPPGTRYLMYAGDHVGAFQQAGVPLRQMINEGNHRPWKKPSDPEGLWERALANPARYADVVIAFDGDALDQAVNRGELTLVTEIHTTGQPYARIYLTRAAVNQSR